MTEAAEAKPRKVQAEKGDNAPMVAQAGMVGKATISTADKAQKIVNLTLVEARLVEARLVEARLAEVRLVEVRIVDVYQVEAHKASVI